MLWKLKVQAWFRKNRMQNCSIKVFQSLYFVISQHISLKIYFFLKKYKTKVIVHNLVGNKDSATAFVESVGEPHFYTYCIVPINVDVKEVDSGRIFTQESQVEDAIRAGIYAMIYESEFKNLYPYFSDIEKKSNYWFK